MICHYVESIIAYFIHEVARLDESAQDFGQVQDKKDVYYAVEQNA